MEQLPEPSVWELWADIATVLQIVVASGFVILGWLWKTGRWIFKPKDIDQVAEPPSPPLGKINLPSGRRVVGREHEVAELRAKLCAGGEVAITHAVISGHGGFGKSTLARYYGETYLNDYHAVVWLPASNPQELIDAIVANLWVPLGLPVTYQPPQRLEMGMA